MIDPDDFETNFNIGVLYYNEKQDWENATHYLETAVSEEKNVEALFLLGRIYENQGYSSKAKDYYN